LYEDLLNEDDVIVNDIYEVLLQKENINRDDLLEVYAKHNNYIVGFDNYKTSLKIEKNITDVLNAVNNAFNQSRRSLVMAAKINENNKNISVQLQGVSKAIDTIANDIEKENKEEFLDKKKQIMLICKQRQIDILDVIINKEKTGRYIIKVLLNTCDDSKIIECPTNKISEILSSKNCWALTEYKIAV
jgi:hypothetical protein